MKNNPLVTIVITSFNRVNDLKEAVEKTKTIDYANLEIIIVDGGSTDGCVEYISTINDERIRSIIIGENKGNCYTTNEGMKNAKGKYIVIIDDDAYLGQSVIDKTVEIFENNDNLGSIGYGLVNPIYREKTWVKNNKSTLNVKELDFDSKYESMIYGSASAYRKSVLEEIRYFDLDWNWSTGGEDNELNFKIIAHGYNTAIIPELTAYHKISQATRHTKQFTSDCILSNIWILLKYYPMNVMIIRLYKLFQLAIYYSLLFKTNFYLRSIFRSISNANKMLRYKRRIKPDIAKQLNLPMEWLFSHDREKEST